MRLGRLGLTNGQTVMPSSSRDLLFLSTALAVASCLMVAGMAIYPDDRQMEVGLSGSPQPIGGVGEITDPISAFVFPPADLFAIRTVHPHWVVVPRQPKLVLRPPNLNSSSEGSSHLLPL